MATYSTGGNKQELSDTCSGFPCYLIHRHWSWSFCFSPNGIGIQFLEKDIPAIFWADVLYQHKGMKVKEIIIGDKGKQGERLPKESRDLALPLPAKSRQSSRSAPMLSFFVELLIELEGTYSLFWMRMQRELENAFLTWHKEQVENLCIFFLPFEVFLLL